MSKKITFSYSEIYHIIRSQKHSGGTTKDFIIFLKENYWDDYYNRPIGKPIFNKQAGTLLQKILYHDLITKEELEEFFSDIFHTHFIEFISDTPERAKELLLYLQEFYKETIKKG